MNTYEYSVASKNTDMKGRATIPSMYTYIVNAIRQNLRMEDKILSLRKSAIEIFERPRINDVFNVIVKPESEGLVREIRLTDYDGYEIGRGTTEWHELKPGTIAPDLTSVSRYVDRFYSLLPSDMISSELYVKLCMDFENAEADDDKVNIGLEKENDEIYRFTVRSGNETLCNARLVTD